jgi:hypothetical protein
MKPVFIISAPRSGTTWLVQALNAHPDVYATELRAFGEYVDLVQDEGAPKPRLRITLDEYINALLQPHQWTLLGSSRDAVRDEILSDLYSSLRQHALRQTGRRVCVDKLTPYLGTADRAVSTIARLYPQAKVIRLTRDGRDVAVSGVMHWLTRSVVGQALSSEQCMRRAFFLDGRSEPPPRFFTEAELGDWAHHWRQPMDALDAHGSSFELLDARYEAMSRDTLHELSRICDFLEVASDASVVQRCVDASTFEVMSGGRGRGQDAPGQHVRKGIVGDWRRLFTTADALLFDRVAGSRLIESSYELDRGWVARAPERLALQVA